jgi:hypothetical protein
MPHYTFLLPRKIDRHWIVARWYGVHKFSPIDTTLSLHLRCNGSHITYCSILYTICVHRLLLVYHFELLIAQQAWHIIEVGSYTYLLS